MLEMKVPSPGESITEVQIASWLVKNGDYVEKDQAIAEVDSDKATLELPAEASGVITLKAGEGDVVKVGEVVCLIDTNAPKPASAPKAETPKAEQKPAAAEKPVATPVASQTYATGTPSVAAQKIMAENNIQKVEGTGKDGRITKQDVLAQLSKGFEVAENTKTWAGSRDEKREKMSMLRRRIAERLVSVKNETAMLTTFNEIDMKPVMDLRAQYKDAFAKKHDINLGFMSFFTKAATEALQLFPAVNAYIENDEIVYHNYADVGVAVSSPKGLMVPVLRNAEQMSLADIEKEIKRLAIKARDGKITIEDMQGGTFTITNGGVFGSMLSTPIINPPQSAILGMHNIVERAVVVAGKVEVRPVMYLALSYDHRIIDGKEAVGFLVKIKEMLENPSRIIFGGKNPNEVLLGL
jgi:2-oxoglutarate dehydrogenase E2 component (dihydrolipoamide succinyltransferase)